MANATDYLENLLMPHVLGITAMPMPVQLYVALCTDVSVPSDATPGTEVSGDTAYTRAAVQFGMVSGVPGEASNVQTLGEYPLYRGLGRGERRQSILLAAACRSDRWRDADHGDHQRRRHHAHSRKLADPDGGLMSGTANRPFGVGPFGTGPYNTYTAPTVLAGAIGGMEFSGHAKPGLTRRAAALGSVQFAGAAPLQVTWPHVSLCQPGTWGAAL
jgi:hypothetical protein